MTSVWTGREPGLLQDDSKELSKWLSRYCCSICYKKFLTSRRKCGTMRYRIVKQTLDEEFNGYAIQRKSSIWQGWETIETYSHLDNLEEVKAKLLEYRNAVYSVYKEEVLDI